MNQIAIHCLVSGTVQGVFFRASTKKEADKLGLSGWVRNLPDGRVEVLACGDRENVAHLQAWLQHGPKAATVTAVTVDEIPWRECSGFRVL